MDSSPVQLTKFTRAEGIHRLKNLLGMKADCIPCRFRKDEDSKTAPAQVLLIMNVLVGGDESVKGCIGHTKQIPILQFRPPHLSGGFDLVRCQVAPQRSGGALVEE